MNGLVSDRLVLVAPLNWGLGHAARCIPIIDSLLQEGAKVCIASDGAALAFLADLYPRLPHYILPSYDIRYSKRNNQLLAITAQIPNILTAIVKEHRALGRLVKKLRPKLIVSDNRYGLWHRDIPSIFICHQLAPIVPAPFQWARKLLFLMHKGFMAPFTEIWIPDFPETPSLSGRLSKDYGLPANAKFIHPLSRFVGNQEPNPFYSYAELNVQKPDIVAILSGPEPQRSLVQEKLIQESHKTDRNFWIVEGRPGRHSVIREGNLTVVSVMQGEDLALLCRQANILIVRSGYSTLMDFAAMRLQNFVLIPTPGQPEQEYLAKHLANARIAPFFPQKDFSLSVAVEALAKYDGFTSSQFMMDKQALICELKRVLEEPESSEQVRRLG